jgi:hypothetical protein
MELPQIWRVGEEKDERMKPGGNDGQNATDLHKRIQACGTKLLVMSGA